MKNKIGKFITLEGCEGVGKSTQARLLGEYFASKNIDAVFTREPGGTEVAEDIRRIILQRNIDVRTELLLYLASRAEHVKNLIIPNLQNGVHVVCDRFVHSTIAYQGYARGLDLQTVEDICAFASYGAVPDAVLFLNLSPKDGFLRKGGADKNDRLEREELAFHMRVYDGFVRMAKSDKTIISIDASGLKNQTHALIVQAVEGILQI